MYVVKGWGEGGRACIRGESRGEGAECVGMMLMKGAGKVR